VSEVKCVVTPQQEILLAQKEDLIANQLIMVKQIEKEKKRWRQIARVRKRKIKALKKKF
jgi:hypothetical protein